MEFIQCPNCQKKYGVNDKIRAAEGKEITCKACSHKFKLALIGDADTHEEGCISCGANKGVYAENFAGEINKVLGKVFPGDVSKDYLCLACKKGFEEGRLDAGSDVMSGGDASSEVCIVCKGKKGRYSKNFAGQINEVKGNLFPGDSSADYLCQKCKVKLEGGERKVAPDRSTKAASASTPMLTAHAKTSKPTSKARAEVEVGEMPKFTLGGLLGVAFIIYLFYAIFSGNSTSNENSSEAVFACQQAVKARLKNPSSADFPWGMESTRDPDGQFRVTSYVDAQNAFGATIRSSFGCWVENGAVVRIEGLR